MWKVDFPQGLQFLSIAYPRGCRGPLSNAIKAHDHSLVERVRRMFFSKVYWFAGFATP